MKPVTIQTATSIEDFELMASRVTNMVDAEYIVHKAAEFAGDTSRFWKRQFCEKHFQRFKECRMYHILMGIPYFTPDGHTLFNAYTPNPF